VLLTISTNHQPATDLGYLLHKNPANVHSFSLSFGKAHVFYPEATLTRCTAALLVDVDPIGLVRTRRGPSGDNNQLDQYVNDRPYVASSFLSVAIGEVFGSAMGGRSKDRPELAQLDIPLEAYLPAVPCRGGDKFLRSLFEPLGYSVFADRLPLDEAFPDWGESPYFSVTLSATIKLSELLTHLYVLIPVLDNDKHYWVAEDEVNKLLRHGGDWLASHPQRDQIMRRYLKNQKSLSRMALARLIPEDETNEPETPVQSGTKSSEREKTLEAGLSLNELRIQSVVNEVKRLSPSSVVDLGCGEGKLLSALLKERGISRLVGLDVSMKSLDYASERLKLDRLPTVVRSKIELLHGSLTYRDKRLSNFDVATVIEVIEHLDQARLSAFERVLFEFAKPMAIIVTTPNSEFNAKFLTLPTGQFRHPDHRFEWTRAEFDAWANRICESHGYTVQFHPIGEVDAELGAPTQMALFEQVQA
jgi:3' terminal RNA ribose 2'-O-methyltransferase Hen1